ncbi:Aminoacylase-1 [Trichoplax sp. H2]|uniref:N-acyl-aliphatic-L-amino acid amidohydrolase n=1 Tax=Trichoplax adhaerens TaxID=10228 RepID=B3RWV3_TRIAD|nr:hypothetical protein TRIADDRAFT_50344 [Trichoplax adhaerens]EDV25194.1 hypothetical protein TRIADDRAFT_50344 [Trichoplax adhaerens]RDD44557.1 Aminoacylase-1 [Trichoplax sp. H2]|eukprot:XP_002113084.1 hypothetical protein TRIADDRAFT_50344 [Trichoplax adhaerens]
MAEEHPAVTVFREYLRINTISSEADYDACTKLLQRLAAEIDLPMRVIEVLPNRPVVLITWEGTDPTLGSLLLNSHTDVVPVYLEHWIHDPFAAIKTPEGDIYARGTQDMKCVGIQYIEAIRRLKKEGKRFKRTIHMSFVPDEERGGREGMQLFCKHEEFKKLNIAYALDEGLANPTEEFIVYNSERPIWGVRIKCTGRPGHGSRFVQNTAMEKLRKLMNKFTEFRNSEEKRMLENNLRLGDVTTINMTMVNGGIQRNVVPADVTLTIDVRLALDVDFQEFEERVRSWADECGDGILITFIDRHMDKSITSIDNSDKWWRAFSSAASNMSLLLITETFPAATDSRFLRQAGIPALGFSPMNYTPVLLHDHNEFLNEKIFLKGIEIYCGIISAMANVD